MESSSDQQDPVASEKIQDSDSPAGVVTTSEGGQVSAGGDASTAVESQEARGAAQEDETSEGNEVAVATASADDAQECAPTEQSADDAPDSAPSSLEEAKDDAPEDAPTASEQTTVDAPSSTEQETDQDKSQDDEEEDNLEEESSTVEQKEDEIEEEGSAVEQKEGEVEEGSAVELKEGEVEEGSAVEQKDEVEESTSMVEQKDDEVKTQDDAEKELVDVEEQAPEPEPEEPSKETEDVAQKDDGLEAISDDELEVLSDEDQAKEQAVDTQNNETEKEVNKEDSGATGDVTSDDKGDEMEAESGEKDVAQEEGIEEAKEDVAADTKDVEACGAKDGAKDGDADDALLKEDKGTTGEQSRDITAAEEDALLKDTEDDKMEDDEAMDVEEGNPGSKPDEDAESMEVDEEPKDVEMQSEAGSVAPEDKGTESGSVVPEDKGTESGSVVPEDKGTESESKPEAEVVEEGKDEDGKSDVVDVTGDKAEEAAETEEVVAKEQPMETSEDKDSQQEQIGEATDKTGVAEDKDATTKQEETDKTEDDEMAKSDKDGDSEVTKTDVEKTSETTQPETEADKDASRDSKAASESSGVEVPQDGDSGSGSRDTTKSPVTAGAKAPAKKGKVGFSLGNIVSQLKKKAAKDEGEGETTSPTEDKGTDSTVQKKDAPEPSEKDSDLASPTKETGSSRRKQSKSAAHHISKDESDKKKEDKQEDTDDDDIVEIVEENTTGNENEGQMKNYATDTMNELLGMFGFDKVDQQETEQLQLGEKFSAKAPPGSTAKPSSPALTPAVKNVKVPEKKIHCTECKQPITSTTNLGWGSQPFCSPKCLTNFQNRQTSVCEYCNGLISQNVRGKYTKEMQTGQRKEFCSAGCVAEYTKRLKTCTHCAKDIKAAELIVAPVGAQNKFKEFCNQGCVDAHERKRQASNVGKGNLHICAVCNKSAKVKHEINFQNVIHRLCSNECFGKFRTKHSLALNFCEQCGVICYNENLVPNVLLDGKMRRFCSQRCVGDYKTKNRRQVPCYNCKKIFTNHNMIEETGPSGDIRLFCTMQCLQTAKKNPPKSATVRTPAAAVTKAPAKAQSSGQQSTTAAPCDHCRKTQRPLYHLTMSDNTIRNFCSYPCVIAFQAQFNVPPVTLPQETLMLKCAFCSTGFIHKPLTLEYKGSISLFCTQGCFDEFKRSNSVVVSCDYCHLEKILHDRSFFSGMAKSFCSEGCKLLFKQQFAQRLGLKCIVCDYCAQTCRSTVEMVYSKTRRRFCGIACRDKYDKWFNKTARCDGCKLMGRTLSETFMWRDEIKKVCDQKCLLLFYTQQNIPNMTTQGQVPIQGTPQVTKGAKPGQVTSVGQREYGPKPPRGVLQQKQESSTPVIANVMSLASINKQQPQQVTQVYRPPVQIVAKATKQTQITTAPPKIKPPPPPPAPLPPAPKMVRNKITLCKPFTQTKSVSCRPVHQHKSCQTDGPRHPILVPIPVPIFIPVPMQMYTTPVPFPIGINTPVPVPMFIPVAAANADKLIKTITEIKEKVPSDPLEAELLMMAEAVAGESSTEDNKSSIAADDDSSATLDEPQKSSVKGDIEPEELPVTLEEAQDIIPSDILAENILQMAAEMTNVLGEDNDVAEDIATLVAPDRPATPKPVAPKRRQKRRGKQRNKRYIVDEEEEAEPGQSAAPVLTKTKEEAKKSIGINAFKLFIQTKLNSMSDKEKRRNKMLRPEVLECATEELYYGLCMFIKESRQPNGEKFPPDMLLIIFLSIQRELFDNERPENIFTDYEQFTQLVHQEVKDWRPAMDPISELVTNSMVDEETLWNSKQLGAHSPYILLSTLLYFNTKCFRLNGVDQHNELAFVRVQKHLRKTDAGRTMYLRYFPKEMMKKIQGNESNRRKRERDDSLELPEQCENTENPLRCPVKLYEFYLSKCPESVKTRTDLFYLVPERSCIPDSPVWYTCQQLPDKDMNHILSRIMLTKDIHETWAAAAHKTDEEYESDY